MESPKAANNRKMMSPRTIPHITARAGLKPEASALATVAKTPGPGLAARMSMATVNPMAEYIVKMLPFHWKWFQNLIADLRSKCISNLLRNQGVCRSVLRPPEE
jgi:hypothetical protein